MSEEFRRSALVLGITGGIGRAVAAALRRRGVEIHALVRDRARAAEAVGRMPVTWIDGDAGDRDAVLRAAEGRDLLFFGVNPPGYRRWRELALPMLANAVEAAERSGARLMFPGNMYVFSPASGPVVDESAPHAPETEKGMVRWDMEAMIGASGAASLVLRAGDFFGPDVPSSWFRQMLVVRGGRVAAVRDLSPRGVGHAWAYVPDLAEAFARLADRDATLPGRAVFHFDGHWTGPGRSMAEAIRAALPGDVPIRPYPWWQLRAAAPFVPVAREALEMRWLWTTPIALDARRLADAVGRVPRTPLDEAVRSALGPLAAADGAPAPRPAAT